MTRRNHLNRKSFLLVLNPRKRAVSFSKNGNQPFRMFLRKSRKKTMKNLLILYRREISKETKNQKLALKPSLLRRSGNKMKKGGKRRKQRRKRCSSRPYLSGGVRLRKCRLNGTSNHLLHQSRLS